MLVLLKQRFQVSDFSKVSFWLMAISTGLLLAGCINIQTNIAIYGQEQWSGVQAITLSSDFVELMESGGSADQSGFTSELSTEELDQWLEQAQTSTNSDDLNVAFNEVTGEDGSLSYILQADGRQFNMMNEIFFQGEADISVEDVNGQQQVTLRYTFSDTTGDTSESAEEIPPEMMEAFGVGNTLRITGGEIIDSNATRVEGNTAIWENPTQIQITFTAAAEFSPESIAVVDQSPSSGLSPENLETIMEVIAQDLETSIENADSPTEVTGESSETVAETTTESPNPATQGTTENADSSTSMATEITDTTAEATAPTGEAEALPQAGANLPENSSAAPLLLASLVLLALGAGATANLFNRY